MNLRDLEYFAAAAELESFGKAADRCFVSQPTLSGQLRKLEEELGHPLFERTTRRVRLTSFGKEALIPVQKALAEVQKLIQKAKERQDPFTGPVTLGAFLTLAPWFLPRIAGTLHERCPKSEFYLTEDKTPNLQAQLKAGDVDAVFLAMPQSTDGIEVIPLFSESFYLAVPSSHPWKKRKTVRTEELKDQVLFLLEDGHCLRDQALDLCNRFGVREKGYFRAAGLETLRQMIRMNMGMTFIPRMAIPDEEESGIHYLCLADEEAHRNIALCFRATHPRRALFVHLAEIIRGLAGTLLPVSAI